MPLKPVERERQPLLPEASLAAGARRLGQCTLPGLLIACEPPLLAHRAAPRNATHTKARRPPDAPALASSLSAPHPPCSLIPSPPAPCTFTPSLKVAFLGYEHNPDLMLLAARALTFLADVFPPAASAIIRHGAVPAFCARLLTIEYIDLAEQSLQVWGLRIECVGGGGVVCVCGGST